MPRPEATDVSTWFRALDSDGAPVESLTAAGLTLWYQRARAAKTALSLVDLAGVAAAHSDGGVIHVDDGWYRLDLPDAACLAGVDEVLIGGTGTGAIVLSYPLALAYTLQQADTGATAVMRGTYSTPPTAAAIADAVWDEATAGHVAAGSFGKLLADLVTSLAATAAAAAAAVWAYATRTLTQSAAQVAAVVAGTTITIQRGDTTTISLSALGNVTGRKDLVFTVKRDRGDTDAEAVLKIGENVGLITVNGADGTAANASLTVTDATTGAITIVIAAAETAKLAAFAGVYDVQWIDASDQVHTLTDAVCNVSGDVTRGTSVLTTTTTTTT